MDGKSNPKTVALVEWTPAGHHRTYFAAFAAALVKIGARVVPFCPWPDELPELLADHHDGEHSGRLEKAERLYWPTASWVRPLWLRKRLASMKHFRDLGKSLESWERKSGVKVDLVFFSCIYDRDFEHFGLGQRFFSKPWAGLYLDCRAFRRPGSSHPSTGKVPHPEELFSLPGLHAVATLDEGSVNKVSALAGGKPAVWFPDVADTRISESASPEAGLGAKLQAFTRGRKLVGCIGHLQKSKGVLELIRAANDPAMEETCFAFVGEVNWYSFTDEEKSEVLAAWESHPRIFVYPLRVPDGPRLNSAVRACDVIAAPYLDFTNSSNMLTKAAVFSKPVVVNDGYLMAERVRDYNLGEVVPEGDQNSLVAALAALGHGTSKWSSNEARWSDFLKMHSQEKLQDSFHKLLNWDTP